MWFGKAWYKQSSGYKIAPRVINQYRNPLDMLLRQRATAPLQIATSSNGVTITNAAEPILYLGQAPAGGVPAGTATVPGSSTTVSLMYVSGSGGVLSALSPAPLVTILNPFPSSIAANALFWIYRWSGQYYVGQGAGSTVQPGITTTAITSRSGTTPGTGSVSLYTWSGSTLGTGTTVTVYSIWTTSAPNAKSCMVGFWNGAWWLLGWDC